LGPAARIKVEEDQKVIPLFPVLFLSFFLSSSLHCILSLSSPAEKGKKKKKGIRKKKKEKERRRRKKKKRKKRKRKERKGY
jgi:hypothetical protein